MKLQMLIYEIAKFCYYHSIGKLVEKSRFIYILVNGAANDKIYEKHVFDIIFKVIHLQKLFIRFKRRKLYYLVK